VAKQRLSLACTCKVSFRTTRQQCILILLYEYPRSQFLLVVSFVKYRTQIAQTASTEQSLSLQVSSRLDGGVFLRMLWVRFGYCVFHNNFSPDHNQKKLHSVKTLKTYFLDVPFDIFLLCRSNKLCPCFQCLKGTHENFELVVFIVVPCILITSRLFSPTNAPFY
jgi:hypothetical protein